jgi:hypothetical protein
VGSTPTGTTTFMPVNFFDPTIVPPSPPQGFPGALKVVFSGTPRGGTFFLWSLLRNLGVVGVSHEAVFWPPWIGTGVRWIGTVVDVTGFAWPYLPCEGVETVRLTRHPVPTIESMVSYFPAFFPDREKWRWAEQYWLRAHSGWDPRVARQVEIYDQWLPEIALRVWDDSWTSEKIRKVAESTNTNALRPDINRFRITWNQLSVETRNLAELLGYRRD